MSDVKVEIRNPDAQQALRVTVQREGRGFKPKEDALFPRESVVYPLKGTTNFRIQREKRATPETDRVLVRGWLERNEEGVIEIPDKSVMRALRRLAAEPRDDE